MWESLPEEDFYGEGANSAASKRSTYGLSGPRAGWVTTATLGAVELRHSVRWDSYQLFAGRDDRFPTTQEVFTPAEVSGGYSNSQFLTNQLAAVLDYRDDPKDPRAGTMITSSVEFRDGIRDTATNFTTLRLAHYFYLPLSERKAHLFAFRAEGVHNITDDAIPFYLEPALGGSNSLRGFRKYRFRDNDALLVTAEYRYRIWTHMDAVIFGDAGQVYPNVFKDATHTKMATDYGAGLRLNTPLGFQMRLNIGHGSEGTQLWFKLGAFAW
jgi:outer membrane protein insertion porin family